MLIWKRLLRLGKKEDLLDWAGKFCDEVEAQFKAAHGTVPMLTAAQIALIPLSEGKIVYNTTSKKLNMCNGTSWEEVTST